MPDHIASWSPVRAAVERLPLCSDRQRMFIIALTVIAGAVYTGYHAFASVPVAAWDWLQISGLATFCLTLYAMGGLRGALFDCVERLVGRGVAAATDDQHRDLKNWIATQADLWGKASSLLVALIMLAVSVVAYIQEPSALRIALGVTLTGLGYVAGGYLGQMSCYGRLSAHFQAQSVTIRVNPWHSDGLGGLKPVADFYWSQMVFSTVPMIFLLAWLWAFPSFPSRADPTVSRYQEWVDPYIALLFVALLFQVLGFLAPLLSFRTHMVAEKRRWRRRIDAELARNTKARSEAFENGDVEQLTQADVALETLNENYKTIEAMPSWPVNRSILGKIALRNLLPVLTLFKAVMQPGLTILQTITPVITAIGGTT
ncbi:MAG: hypothetical protein AAF666_05810 [Pseudomonadota bacterium]